MAAIYLNSYSAVYTSAPVQDLGIANVQANSGELIVLTIQYRDQGTRNISTSPTWNGQNMTSSHARLNGYMWVQTWYVIASATATANIIATVDAGEFLTGASLARTYSGAASVSAAVTQSLFDGTYANPSLTSGSLATGDLIDEFLGSSGYSADGGFSDMTAVTWAETNSQTRRNTILSTGTNVGNLIFSTKTGTGAITVGYTPTGGQPAYAHVLLRIVAAAAGPTIDTITSPITHGQTGLAITTTGLGTLTGMTVDTVAVASVSATGGDGTWVAKTRVDGATLPGYGSKAVVVGDGTLTATGSVTVNPPATQSFVTLTSVNTSAGYLGAYRTLNVGDQIAFDLAATLGVTANYIDVDGGIYTDFAGTQTIWHWVATTRVTTQITLINGIPQVAGSEGITTRGITSRGLSSRNISKRGLR